MSSLYNDKKKKSSSVSERLYKSGSEFLSKGSLKGHYFHSMNGIHDKQHNSNEIISNLLDNLNKNSLNIFYRDSSSIFKKKIDDLNLRFYLETEKYLSNQNKQEKTQSSLFIILFKQIKVYIEEIERLNLIILQRKYEPRNIIERTDEILKKQKDLETKEQLIKTLKDSKTFTENKLSEILLNEDKLKKENEKLKQQNEIYRKKLHELNFNSKNLKLSKTLTQSIFHSSKLNIFGNSEEKKSSDITKACSNLSDNFNEYSHQKRNNSENKQFSSTFSNGFSVYNQLANQNSEKKSIGIIKSVKEKMKREKKIFSLENFQKKDTLNNLYNMNKPNLNVNISNNNKSKEFDSFQELKIDFNQNINSNNKNLIKTEIIVSDLEDYYSNYKQQNTFPINKNIKYNNSNMNQIKTFNTNINSTNSNVFISNNNKKLSPKKIPIIQSIKVKMNK